MNTYIHIFVFIFMYIYIYIATGTKTVKSIMNPCMSQILSGIN